MTWTQGRPAAEGPAEPEQEAPGLPRLPQGHGSPGLVPAGLEPWGSLRGGHRRGWSSSPGLSSARDGRGAEGPESDTAGRCLFGSDPTVMDSVHQDPPLAFRAFSSTSDIHIKCGCQSKALVRAQNEEELKGFPRPISWGGAQTSVLNQTDHRSVCFGSRCFSPGGL